MRGPQDRGGRTTGRRYRSIDEYIRQSEPSARTALMEMRKAIREAAPTATETISYQIPTFKLGENLVHFAAFRTHIGFYPTSSGVRVFRSRLKPYKTSVGAIQFPIEKPLPLELVKAIVRFRVEEVERPLRKE